MSAPLRRYLVTTDHGDVVVTVNSDRDGLDPGLLTLASAGDDASEFGVATPLRAFAAKMIDLIEIQGTDSFTGGERMRTMLIQEKATADLRRIERFARDHAAG